MSGYAGINEETRDFHTHWPAELSIYNSLCIRSQRCSICPEIDVRQSGRPPMFMSLVSSVLTTLEGKFVRAQLFQTGAVRTTSSSTRVGERNS